MRERPLSRDMLWAGCAGMNEGQFTRHLKWQQCRHLNAESSRRATLRVPNPHQQVNNDHTSSSPQHCLQPTAQHLPLAATPSQSSPRTTARSCNLSISRHAPSPLGQFPCLCRLNCCGLIQFSFFEPARGFPRGNQLEHVLARFVVPSVSGAPIGPP
jgi:hypothetical protein